MNICTVRLLLLVPFHAGKLFPFSIEDALKYIKDVVREWFDLGLALGLSNSCLRTIEADHHGSVMKCKREMLWQWMSSSQEVPPCWWTLMKGLQSIDFNTQAEKIETIHGM